MAPYPFSRGLFVYAEPLLVPRDAGEALMEEKRAALERALNELTDYADRSV